MQEQAGRRMSGQGQTGKGVMDKRQEQAGEKEASERGSGAGCGHEEVEGHLLLCHA